MTPTDFTYKSRKLDVYIKGFGITHAHTLFALKEKPMEVIKREKVKIARTQSLPSPDVSGNLGLLIKNGLATISEDRNNYIITDKGIAHLDKLEANKLI